MAFQPKQGFLDRCPTSKSANSAVGTSVIQFAKRLGVKVINLVRREELQKPLTELGAKHVFLDDEDSPTAIHDLTAGAG